MMINRTLILYSFLFLLSGCKNDSESFPLNNLEASDIKHFRELALTKGDTNAYYQLHLDNFDSPYQEFCNTAKIMADKYEYHLAFYNFYECLTAESTDLNQLDAVKKDLALQYLKKGAKNGNKNCLNTLGHFYIEGKYVKKDIVKGKKLIEESDIE